MQRVHGPTTRVQACTCLITFPLPAHTASCKVAAMRYLQLRLPSPLRRRIGFAAVAEDQTVSAYTRGVLQKWVAADAEIPPGFIGETRDVRRHSQIPLSDRVLVRLRVRAAEAGVSTNLLAVRILNTGVPDISDTFVEALMGSPSL